MKKLPVGVQVYSVRDDAAKDFKGTMQAIKDMGYDCVELAGLYGMEPAAIRAALDAVGIPALSAHVPYAELVADIPGTVAAYVTIGCKYIAVPYLMDEDRPGTPAFPQVMENIAKIGEECNKQGITLLYHNHDFEFVRLEDGRYGLDTLYETVPASLLQTELDTCWVNVAGEDPAAYIRKYAGRCPVVHLKDFFMDRENKPEQMYELIGVEKKAGDRGSFEFRPVGHGLQDMPSILAAAVESGASYVVVEQDMSVGRTPMEAIRMSREYLKSQGW